MRTSRCFLSPLIFCLSFVLTLTRSGRRAAGRAHRPASYRLSPSTLRAAPYSSHTISYKLLPLRLSLIAYSLSFPRLCFLHRCPRPHLIYFFLFAPCCATLL